MFLIVLLTVGELTVATALMIRLFVYIILLFLIVIVCYYYTFVKKNALNEVILGLMKQILILFIGQIVLLGWINLSVAVVHSSTTFAVRIVTAILFALIGVVLLYWYILSLISIIKDIGHFGGTVISSAIQTVTNTANGVRGKVTTKYQEIKNGRIHGTINVDDEDISEDIKQSVIKTNRRKQNIDRLNNKK
jgi:hypothetical protein